MGAAHYKCCSGWVQSGLSSGAGLRRIQTRPKVGASEPHACKPPVALPITRSFSPYGHTHSHGAGAVPCRTTACPSKLPSLLWSSKESSENRQWPCIASWVQDGGAGLGRWGLRLGCCGFSAAPNKAIILYAQDLLLGWHEQTSVLPATPMSSHLPSWCLRAWAEGQGTSGCTERSTGMHGDVKVCPKVHKKGASRKRRQQAFCKVIAHVLVGCRKGTRKSMAMHDVGLAIQSKDLSSKAA